MNDHDAVFSIGALAEATGVSPPTIRYYEDIKLIPPAHRSAAGHRHYTRADVVRLTFIRRCRDLGFGLDQIRHLASLSTSPDRDCVEVRDIASAHWSISGVAAGQRGGIAVMPPASPCSATVSGAGSRRRPSARWWRPAFRPSASSTIATAFRGGCCRG